MVRLFLGLALGSHSAAAFVKFPLFRNAATRDERAHRRLVKSGLALDKIISWHMIPVLNEDDELVFESWPFILPHDMELGSVNNVAFPWRQWL